MTGYFSTTVDGEAGRVKKSGTEMDASIRFDQLTWKGWVAALLLVVTGGVAVKLIDRALPDRPLAFQANKPEVVINEQRPEKADQQGEQPELGARQPEVNHKGLGGADDVVESRVPRTVSDGPGIGNLDRARRMGNWVRHGNEANSDRDGVAGNAARAGGGTRV